MSAPGTLTASLSRAALHRSPLLLFLAALWLLLWTMLCLVEVASLLHNPRVPIWHPFTIVFISTAVVGSWLTWTVKSGRFERIAIDPPMRWFRYHLRALPWLIVGCIVLVTGLRQLAYQLMGVSYKYVAWYQMIPFESAKIALFYGLWLALMFGLLTLARRREESERMLGMQKALAEAQLAQLQAQLRPHFLFNALNTVSSLMMTDTARADRVLAQLGDLLRVSLAAGRSGQVTLRDELDVLQKYAGIMQERFEGQAVLHWQVPDEALRAPMPSMLLQPLLENAFKHGVERNSEPVHITVSATAADGVLCVEIHNTRSTLAECAGQQGGVGLRNCRERLHLLYGPAAELVVAEDAAGGVVARVTLPWPAQAA